MPDRAAVLEIAGALGAHGGDRLLADSGVDAFAALGDLVVPGPTFTNVNDFRALLVLWAGAPVGQTYALLVFTFNSISLAFDLVDAARWLGGRREVLGLDRA